MILTTQFGKEIEVNSFNDISINECECILSISNTTIGMYPNIDIMHTELYIIDQYIRYDTDYTMQLQYNNYHNSISVMKPLFDRLYE